MKKKFKKLELKKEVISNLSQSEMSFYIGGTGYTSTPDPTSGVIGTSDIPTFTGYTIQPPSPPLTSPSEFSSADIDYYKELTIETQWHVGLCYN